MRILAIETSCDETAISIVEASGGLKNPKFKILAETVVSQIQIHQKYGGVFPTLAKREHVKNLLPVLEKTLTEANLISSNNLVLQKDCLKKIKKILDKESEITDSLILFLQSHNVPQIDIISVTYGPGLEPALWTGINFAKVLSLVWNKPIVPTNHMEGHLFSFFAKNKKIICNSNLRFPSLGLLLSGGHTELILIKKINSYKTIGQTRDDAVGEAYDKVARMLDLPYPGGPEISKLSQDCKLGRRTSKLDDEVSKYKLPRPMINTNDFDFSFSGLKTAVLYMIKKIPKLNLKIKQEIAFEFEEAVIEVLLKKIQKAIEQNKIKTLILGGGVIANKKIRDAFNNLESKDLKILIPEIEYSTDNAVMIAIAGYFRFLDGKIIEPKKVLTIKANGNLRF